MKLIDANLLIYSVGVEHLYKGISLDILAKGRRGELEMNINAEVLQEVLYYYHRRGRLALGFRLFDDLAVQFPYPFPISGHTARQARDLLERYPSVQSRDAIHAAVVFENQLEGIISADRGLDVIDGLVRFDPKELAA